MNTCYKTALLSIRIQASNVKDTLDNLCKDLKIKFPEPVKPPSVAAMVVMNNTFFRKCILQFFKPANYVPKYHKEATKKIVDSFKKLIVPLYGEIEMNTTYSRMCWEDGGMTFETNENQSGFNHTHYTKTDKELIKNWSHDTTNGKRFSRTEINEDVWDDILELTCHGHDENERMCMPSWYWDSPDEYDFCVAYVKKFYHNEKKYHHCATAFGEETEIYKHQW